MINLYNESTQQSNKKKHFRYKFNFCVNKFPLQLLYLKLSTIKKRVLCSIYSFSNKKWFPSLRTIAKDVGLSHTQVNRIVNNLVKLKILFIERGLSHEDSSKRKSNTYKFNWSTIWKYLSNKGRGLHNRKVHITIFLLNKRVSKKPSFQESKSEPSALVINFIKKRKNKNKEILLKKYGEEIFNRAFSEIMKKSKIKNIINYLNKNRNILDSYQTEKERIDYTNRKIKEEEIKAKKDKIELEQKIKENPNHLKDVSNFFLSLIDNKGGLICGTNK